MKILFPDNWMQKIIPFIDQDNDFILVGSISQMGGLTKEDDLKKVILYNWDHYNFVDMVNRPDWVRFHHLCRKALEVWMPTHAHASFFKRDTGIDSYVINLACVDPEEWDGKNSDGGYILMSSRKDWYKRFAMFEQACRDLDIPYMSTHPEDTPRSDYVGFLKNCRGYVQASIDESLGGLSLMEAVWNGKPVLMSDGISGGKEIYGDAIGYFRSYYYLDFQRKLMDLNLGRISQPLAKSKIENQTPRGVADQINKRICQLKFT